MKQEKTEINTLIFILITFVAAIMFAHIGFRPLSVLMFGLVLGYTLQRARFCIASAFTDILMFKDGTLFRALIVFILVSTLGFFLVERAGGEGFVVAMGWHTVSGAVLFGCGMVLAGGCAAGTLMRLGEGYVLFVPVLIGLIAGSTLGAYHYPFWGRPSSLSGTVFLPDIVGLTGAVIGQGLVLCALWWAVGRLENK